VAIFILLVLHWQLSVFFQSFFLHRYGAHRQFTMSKGWERTFHFLTWAVQGPSYLRPRAYAIMHRMHHAFSDTPKDPHSPIQQKNLVAMMRKTLTTYVGITNGTIPVEARFEGGYPQWKLFDQTLSNYTVSVAWGTLYGLYYIAFATHWWMFLFLPLHWFMGPMHGAIVNWFGHKLGYRNYAAGDHSRNTLVIDFLTMGELFQNNHHKWGQSPSFAVRWFEIDPAYQIMRLFAALHIIDMSRSQKARWEPEGALKGSALPLAAPSPMDGE
jgi:stearoyl-CoA desaturase (Delta-9 desaturase)